MKIYLIPVESVCNGKCDFCITKFRDKIDSEFIKLSKLKKLDKFQNIQRVQITGGGEPSCHPKIDEIIDYCSKRWATSIYTNGNLAPPKNTKVEICVSRVHYDDKKNEGIMGVKYDFDKYLGFNVKLSLMLHKNGINSLEELKRYLFWAREKGVKKVVVRRIACSNSWKSHEIARKYNIDIDDIFIKKIEGSFGDFVEFDLESCNTCNSNLILRSDGEYYLDWNSVESITKDKFLISYLKKIAQTSTCIGRKVSSVIVKDGKVLGIGSNSNSDCLKKKICNRVVKGRNEDYSACLCTHAEINAINDALLNKNNLPNSKIYIYGHHTICEHCKKILEQYKMEYDLIK